MIYTQNLKNTYAELFQIAESTGNIRFPNNCSILKRGDCVTWLLVFFLDSDDTQRVLRKTWNPTSLSIPVSPDRPEMSRISNGFFNSNVTRAVTQYKTHLQSEISQRTHVECSGNVIFQTLVIFIKKKTFFFPIHFEPRSRSGIYPMAVDKKRA